MKFVLKDMTNKGMKKKCYESMGEKEEKNVHDEIKGDEIIKSMKKGKKEHKDYK